MFSRTMPPWPMLKPRPRVGKHRKTTARAKPRNLRQEDILDKLLLRKSDGAIQGSGDKAMQEMRTNGRFRRDRARRTLPLLRLSLRQYLIRMRLLIHEVFQPGCKRNLATFFIFAYSISRKCHRGGADTTRALNLGTFSFVVYGICSQYYPRVLRRS